MGPNDATLYQATHTGNPGDVAFYREFCAGLDRVLELGSGSGRVALELAEVCKAVVGLEKDRDHLALALAESAAPNLRFREGDMRSYRDPSSFDAVVLPYSGLYCLASEADVRECLLGVWGLLKPGGGFALDAYAMDELHLNPEHREGTDALELILELIVDGGPVEVFESSHWSRAEQSMRVEYEYRFGDGTRRNLEIAHRYLLMNQLTDLLLAAGFEKIERFGSFEKATYDRDSEHWVVTAYRPTVS